MGILGYRGWGGDNSSYPGVCGGMGIQKKEKIMTQALDPKQCLFTNLGRHLVSVWRHLGSILEGSGRHLEASGRYL